MRLRAIVSLAFVVGVFSAATAASSLQSPGTGFGPLPQPTCPPPVNAMTTASQSLHPCPG